MMFLRIYFSVPPHSEDVHLRVFTSRDQQDWRYCGNLIMNSTAFILLSKNQFATEMFPEEDAHDRTD
jgi:hypothetical protein